MMYQDEESIYDRIVEYAMEIYGREVKAGTCGECSKYLVLSTISDLLEIFVKAGLNKTPLGFKKPDGAQTNRKRGN